MTYRDLIVDASFLARRAWEAAPDDDKRREMLMQAVCSKLVHWLTDDRFARIVFAWDGAVGRRHDSDRPWCPRRAIWEDYKARRKPPPSGYYDDLDELRGRLGAFGIVQAWSEEGEADDVIAGLVGLMAGPHCVWSVDKDLLQLVAAGVDVLRPDTSRRPRDVDPDDWKRPEDKLIGIETIAELTGHTPRGWRDFLALAGDNTDGIPGLKKVGKARANSILAACPDVVSLVLAGRDDQARLQVMANDASMAQWVELAIEQRKELQVSVELVELRPRVPVAFDERDAVGPAEADEIAAWLQMAGLEEFAAWVIERVPAWRDAGFDDAEPTF